jgi:hypothetical protein
VIIVKRTSTYTVTMDEDTADDLTEAVSDALQGLGLLESLDYAAYSAVVNRGTIDRLLSLRTAIDMER